MSETSWAEYFRTNWNAINRSHTCGVSACGTSGKYPGQLVTVVDHKTMLVCPECNGWDGSCARCRGDGVIGLDS